MRAGAEPFRYPGSGRAACLLIHGWGGSPAELRPLGKRLAEGGLHAIAVRLPGHATSMRDFARARWPDWLGVVQKAFEELCLEFEQILLCGFSLGGTLALHLAAEYAGESRLTGLVTINAPVSSPVWYRSLRRLPSLVLPGRLAEKPLDALDPSGAEKAIFYPNPPLRAAFQARRLILATRRRLAQVRQPLLVIQSAHDRSINVGDGRRILEQTASTDKQLIWLEGAAHLDPLNAQAARTQEVVVAFCKARTK